jgi:hypothetical protein
MNWLRRKPIVFMMAVLASWYANAAVAQLQTGNLYGKVVDQQGAALPGVTVTLDTGAAPETQVTNAQGEFRFLSLPPATMRLKTELEGFSTIEQTNINIAVGHNTSLEITMSSAVEDVITVTAESPLLDERKISAGTTLNQTELQKIPTSRDPWTVLQSTPGVQVDRVNVGGNESSQQSVYVGPGSSSTNSVWAVDGVVITDMAALGSSPSYYDFDAFQEMQVTTGGTDSTLATGGVVLNMVTKRGTNEWRGTARYLNAPSAAQSSTSFSNNQLAPSETTRPNAFNQIRGIDDFGGDIGGPVVRDHLWIWGSYGDQKISTLTTGGIPYNAQIPTYNGKINAQITSGNSLTLFALQNDKKVAGRNAGPTRPLPTAWDQGHAGSDPSAAKIEDTQIFGPSFYLTALASDVNGGFQLAPIGGLGPTAYLDGQGEWHNSFLDFVTTRPQKQGKIDASTFFNTGQLSNELKFGVSYRHVLTTSMSQWGGAGFIINSAIASLPDGDNEYIAVRPSNINVTNNYTSAYLQDTGTIGNLTLNAGVRYDRQTGTNNASSVSANAVLPNLLPAFSFGGAPAPFSWSNVVPRIGATYALGKDRATLLRASYSRFADQLGAAFVTFTNPATISYYYGITHDVGPGNPTVVPGSGFGYSGNVNPATGLPFVNSAVASNLSAPITDEGLLSIEHAFLPELVGSVNLTYRRISNAIDSNILVFDCAGSATGCQGDDNSLGRPATRSDFQPVTVPVTLPNGSVRDVTYYTLKPGVFTRAPSVLGVLAPNYLANGDRTQAYEGASFALTKRLSNRWMMRGNFTVNSWKWHNTGSLADPTEGPSGGSQNGDYVLTNSAGSGPKQFVFIGAKWTGSLNALYQVMPDRPWGFNVAGNFTARQGYPVPFFVQQPVNVNGNYVGNPADQVLAESNPDSVRLPAVYDFDARIEKEFSFQDWSLVLGVDCFNVFNSSTVLQRFASLGTAAQSPNTGDFVYEILSPRIFRFGARISFR